MPLVLVPGFTQTAASWDPVLAHLPPDLEALAVDVPAGLDFVETATAIGEQRGRAVYCGYSMGGRLCLRLALDRPDLVRGLVLLSASPGIADAAGLDARRAGNTVATLTHALRALGQGSQEALWARLGDLEPPFVPAAGVLDEKYVDIAFEMAGRVGPDVHPVLIGGAGHAAHLENPDAVAALLRRVAHDVTS